MKKTKLLLIIFVLSMVIVVSCKPQDEPKECITSTYNDCPPYQTNSDDLTPEQRAREEFKKRMIEKREEAKQAFDESLIQIELQEIETNKRENFFNELYINFTIECVEWQSITTKELVDEYVSSECIFHLANQHCGRNHKICKDNVEVYEFERTQYWLEIDKCNNLENSCYQNFKTNKTLALENGCLVPSHFINVTEQKCVKELLIKRPK